MTKITGYTRVFGILADPIRQVKTPEVLNGVMARRGFDGVLVPLQVAPHDLPRAADFLRAAANVGGVVVTVPHKTAMLALCDEVEPHAALVGAVNCVRREPDGRLIGAMLDGIGFVAGLRRSGIDPRGRRVYLAGAGGAANAIAFSLAESGVAHLTVANRTRTKSEDLARRLRASFPELSVALDGAVAGHDLVVNGTSLGLRPGDPLPLDASALVAEQVVAEIIMDPDTTPLLAEAAARGCRIHRGRPMLEEQAELMADHMGIPRGQ